MRVEFSHVYGEQEKFDIHVALPKLILEDTPETEALALGWTIYDHVWYQLRSTRIDTYSYFKKCREIKGHTVELNDAFVLTPEHELVYNTFRDKKKFIQCYRIDTDLERAAAVSVRKNGELVAFTKLIRYTDGLESQFTVWDYAEPRLSIGKKILDHEVAFARKMGLRYLYIGPGYGEGSTYKADFEGFEWWTGSQWSTDKDKYIELCRRDSSIGDLTMLSRIMNNDSSPPPVQGTDI
jgi:hypothetical protein